MDAAALRKLVFLVALLAMGCTRTAPTLSGVLFPVPVYPDANLRDTMAASTTDKHGQPVTETQTWWLRFEDPPDRVVAFYDERLTGARKTVTGDVPGTVAHYEWTPGGAEPGESVIVNISQSEIQISEILRPGRRPTSSAEK